MLFLNAKRAIHFNLGLCLAFFLQPHDGDLEHFAYIERVCGQFPEHILHNARSHEALDCFDRVAHTVKTEALSAEDNEERSKILARLRRRAPLNVSPR